VKPPTRPPDRGQRSEIRNQRLEVGRNRKSKINSAHVERLGGGSVFICVHLRPIPGRVGGLESPVPNPQSRNPYARSPGDKPLAYRIDLGVPIQVVRL